MKGKDKHGHTYCVIIDKLELTYVVNFEKNKIGYCISGGWITVFALEYFVNFPSGCFSLGLDKVA